MGCLAAGVNGGAQPVFAIIFSEILNIFGGATPIEEQEADIIFYSLLFVAIGGAMFVANILQV